MTNDILLSFYKQFPLVRIFPYNDTLFAFDSKSNLLAEVTWDQIEALTKLACDDDFRKEHLGIYHDLIANGAFLPHGLKQIVPPKHEIERNIEYDICNAIPRKFILEVTQNCTLKCRYCYFSEDNINRVHTNVKMSKEIAKDAIDLYFKTYTGSLEGLPLEKKRKIMKLAVPSLSWWGGEPFLNFELMKWSKQYFETLPWSKFDITPDDLVYSVVSNFTIIDSDIIDFLVSNNVYTFISLDGNQKHHDANRIFTRGVGSFDVVKNNIDTLINKHPDYCKKYVCLQSVKADNIDFNSAWIYINETFKGKVMKCMAFQQAYWGNEREEELALSLVLDKDFYERFYNSLNNLDEEKFDEILDNHNDYYEFFRGIFAIEKTLIFNNPKGSNVHSRRFSCPIGIDAVFADANGLLHMCNKSDYSYPIGNVKEGFDMALLTKMYENYYTEFESKCKECWAFSFCKICPATSMINGKFHVKNSDACKLSQIEINDKLYGYIILSHYQSVYDNAQRYCNKKDEGNSFLTFEGSVYKSNY